MKNILRYLWLLMKLIMIYVWFVFLSEYVVIKVSERFTISGPFYGFLWALPCFFVPIGMILEYIIKNTSKGEQKNKGEGKDLKS